MTAFVPLAHLDTWALSSSLRSKLSSFNSDGVYRVRENDRWMAEVRKEWTALWNVCARIKQHPAAKEWELGSVWIEALTPHTESTWRPSPADCQEAQMAITTNPAAFVFCGPNLLHFPIGALIALDAAPRCAVNWGDWPRHHLILEFRQKESEE